MNPSTPKGIFSKLLLMRRRTKPKSLEEYVGHHHLLEPGKELLQALKDPLLPSIIAYGPSGIGKTTIAGLLAKKKGYHYKELHFFSPGKLSNKHKETFDEVVEGAMTEFQKSGIKTAVVLDEIHRATKDQQTKVVEALDAGAISVVGTTVFNPEEYLIPSLLAHCKKIPLMTHSERDLHKILHDILKDKEYGLGDLDIRFDPDAEELLCWLCNGNAKNMLIFLEREVFRQLAGYKADKTKYGKAFVCQITRSQVEKLYSHLVKRGVVEVRKKHQKQRQRGQVSD